MGREAIGVDGSPAQPPVSPTTELTGTLVRYSVMSFVAVHLGVKMADTLSFTAKVDMVDF